MTTGHWGINGDRNIIPSLGSGLQGSGCQCGNIQHYYIYSHFKQICNIRLYLQTLSRKGIERLPIPKKCRILKQNDYICNASIDSKGYCFYKATNGIKRHLAVDTLGFPFFTHCTPANVTDDVGLVEMLTLNMDYFRAKPVTIPKITILLDREYHITFLMNAPASRK